MKMLVMNKYEKISGINLKGCFLYLFGEKKTVHHLTLSTKNMILEMFKLIAPRSQNLSQTCVFFMDQGLFANSFAATYKN